ncbi:MAG: hypothetical protein JNN15_17785, partial [Blastocatellia bacterium]|nr:hypothetical protein [Blastocatellia bacterium]
TSIRGSYGIFYNRNLLVFPNNAASNKITDSVFEAREGSFLDDDGFFLPDDPTLANPFIGPLIPGADGPTTVDPNLATPYVQQFTLGVEREIVRDLILSVEGIHTFGVKFPQVRFTPDFADTGAFVAISTLKNWYDGLFVKLEKRPGSSFYSFIGSYTFSKALNLSNDDLVTEPDPLSTQQIRKGPAVNDIRHRFTMSGIVNMPLGFKMSSILTVESAVPVSIFVGGAGGGALPFVQRGAGARQFDTGAELNAFIRQLNTARAVPLPLVRDDVRLGNNFVSMDVRLAKDFKVNEKFRIQGIAEVFNIFNKTNVRGSSGGNFAGIDNVIIRDSNNPSSPGFLRSSNFGARRQTAGGVFGTGGPRALQLAVRVQF